MASDRDAFTDVRAVGAVSDLVRDGFVHAARAGQSLAACSVPHVRFPKKLVDDCDHRSVFFGRLRRLFRMLAAMGLLGLNDIHRANGIKNFLGICINSVAVIAFAISHLVEWRISLLMAVAALLGGYVGARTARRVGPLVIRRVIVVIGFVITIVMLWRMR
jgi:tetrahydromethanopterin S-methyltransferase subunit F